MLDINEINKFLTPQLCEDAGIIVINISDQSLDLGAMNLDYIKVKNLVNTIESEFKLQVSLKQITSLEWETWFENNHATSVEKIQKSSLQNQNNENIISNYNELPETSKKDFEVGDSQYNLQNNDEYINTDEIELIDDANDEALIKLAQANIGDESEMDNDILFGEELTASNDPVRSGVASILSKCFTLKGSDIHAEPLEDRLRIRSVSYTHLTLPTSFLV